MKRYKSSALNLYILLTMAEAIAAGVPLLNARSLSEGGYSFSRILLLTVWLICSAICIWVSVSVIRKAFLYESMASLIKSRSLILREWLIILSLICWVAVAMFFFRKDFLTYVWVSLPVIMNQYWPALAVIGIWALQSLLAMMMTGPASSNLSSEDANIIVPRAIQLFLVALFIYAYTAVNLRIAPRSTTEYFPELAQSFLQGRLDLPNPPATKDLTLFDGKYYVSFPPLGALMMMPLVALRGIKGVNIILFNGFFAALGVMFTFLMLETMKMRGTSQLQWRGHALLALFLGFGTAQYSLAMRVLVNFTSQILTTAFLALSLWIAVAGSYRRFRINALLAGSALGLAMLARPNIVFAWLAIAALQLQVLYDTDNFSYKRYFQWVVLSLIPIVTAILALFWYNQARFGSPFDFGYTHMLVADVLKNDLAIYGQFNPHFIMQNLYDNFVRLPYWDETCRKFTPSPQGMSILFASPLIIYLFFTFKKKIWIVGAWLSIGILAILHALYYSSGATQVGYRFSLDFMPIVIMLLAYGFKNKFPRLAVLSIAASVTVNYIGVLWITHRWCGNF